MTQILGLFTNYLSQYFVVAMMWLAGAILAVLYRHRHPKVSRLTLIAIAIFLLESLVSTYASSYLPLMLRDRGWTTGQLTFFIPLMNIGASLIQAIAWGFILAAIFARRANP